jgi:segregation and condensation protein A
MNYTIKIQSFEGPFDLLLFFIERDELDIYDIPIASITDDFLAYIRQLENMNIDVASEFILVAAKLMRIKARLLLPRPQLDEQGNEIDPRDELVQKLLEYKKYKSILDDMSLLEEQRSKKVARGNISKELQSLANKALVEIELESLNLFKLLKAFENVIDRFELEKRRPSHKIIQYPYTIEEQSLHIVSLLNKKKRVNFSELFDSLENRMHAIVTFLSLLELLNERIVHITLGQGRNNFWLHT